MRIVFRLKGLNGVNQFHDRRNGGIEMEALLDVLGHLPDGLVHAAAQDLPLIAERFGISSDAPAP